MKAACLLALLAFALPPAASAQAPPRWATVWSVEVPIEQAGTASEYGHVTLAPMAQGGVVLSVLASVRPENPTEIRSVLRGLRLSADGKVEFNGVLATPPGAPAHIQVFSFLPVSDGGYVVSYATRTTVELLLYGADGALKHRHVRRGAGPNEKGDRHTDESYAELLAVEPLGAEGTLVAATTGGGPNDTLWFTRLDAQGKAAWEFWWGSFAGAFDQTAVLRIERGEHHVWAHLLTTASRWRPPRGDDPYARWRGLAVIQRFLIESDRAILERQLELDRGRLSCGAFAPDGRAAAVLSAGPEDDAGWEGSRIDWYGKEGTRERTILLGEGSGCAVGWRDDGTTVLWSGGDDMAIVPPGATRLVPVRLPTPTKRLFILPGGDAVTAAVEPRGDGKFAVKLVRLTLR
jgi:hypothetical protein